MPITSYTHDEPEYAEKPIFIVRSPEGLSRKIMGVTFVEGVARLTDPIRAQRFDEMFPQTFKVETDKAGREKVVVDSPGYQITLPTGYPRWKNAVHPEADDYSDDNGEESDAILVSDEPWE